MAQEIIPQLVELRKENKVLKDRIEFLLSGMKEIDKQSNTIAESALASARQWTQIRCYRCNDTKIVEVGLPSIGNTYDTEKCPNC